jgi:transposase-like protein
MESQVDTLKFNELTTKYNDEASARELLERLRWPNGPVCPHCESTEAYKLTPKADTETHVRQGVYKCKKCRKQFTVTVGTIFEGARIPLQKWLMAIYLMCASKKGISSHQLHRMLDVTYKTAWFMTHRIRFAMTQTPMAEKLTGTVEVDETYVGGKKRGGKRGRSTENKTPVVALVQRNGDVRAFKVKNVTAKTLKEAIDKNVSKDANLMTDGFPAYKGLDQEYASHQTVDHGAGEYVRGDVYTNTAEGWFALLKRGIMGTFHHVSEKHLDRYVNEFEFRYNLRKTNDGDRAVAAIVGAKGKRLTYKKGVGDS